jgi:hypothetical protein
MRGWIAIVVAAAVGCGGQSAAPAADGGGDAGGSSSSGDADTGSVIIPDAFVMATVQDTAGGTCNLTAPTTVLDVGAPTSFKPATVQNNGAQPGGGAVTVTCSVVASNGGFDVQLDAEQLGPQGGSLRISSPAGQGAVTTAGGTVSVTFTNETDVGSDAQDNCTITYTYQGLPLSDPSLLGTNPPVAAGRIWGHVSCPAATDNLTSPPAQCDGEADFLFENCAGS